MTVCFQDKMKQMLQKCVQIPIIDVFFPCSLSGVKHCTKWCQSKFQDWWNQGRRKNGRRKIKVGVKRANKLFFNLAYAKQIKDDNDDDDINMSCTHDAGKGIFRLLRNGPLS